jgi:hypothetical protein
MSLLIQGSSSLPISSLDAVTSSGASAGIPSPPLGGLNLTAGQQERIEEILGELQSGVVTADQAQTQINAVLTSQQQQFFQSTSPKGNAASGAAPDGSLPQLNLTPDQKAKIEKIFQTAAANDTPPGDVRTQVNAVLTDAQKQLLAPIFAYGPRGAPVTPAPAFVVNLGA